MKVEFISSMGTDRTVVDSARVSFNLDSMDDNGHQSLSEKDSKLITYLAKHNHFTPFTHCVITFRETVPIFVARQRFKHTIGFTYNEISRRYVDVTPEFYYPGKWRKRAENVKQGSSKETIKDHYIVKKLYDNFMKEAESVYKILLNFDVAPEQARMILPQSMYTSYYVTGSLYAYARAYNLRSEETAQTEIRELAKQWNEHMEKLFPISWKELTNNNNNNK